MQMRAWSYCYVNQHISWNKICLNHMQLLSLSLSLSLSLYLSLSLSLRLCVVKRQYDISYLH